MCRANERYVNVRLADDLHLWNDDLSRKGILRVGDRVIQQANAANNLARNAYLVRYIGGIAIDLFTFGPARGRGEHWMKMESYGYTDASMLASTSVTKYF